MAISDSQRTTIDIGEYLIGVRNPLEAAEAAATVAIDEIRGYLSSGKSPVVGESFPKLSPKYAEKMKGGDTTPNLYLEGDLQNSLDWELIGTDLIIGVDDSQEGKSDGHTNFSGDSKLPQRRFLADEGQVFKFQDKIYETVSLFQEDIEQVLEQVIAESTNKYTPAQVKDLDELEYEQQIIKRKPKQTSIELLGIQLQDLLR